MQFRQTFQDPQTFFFFFVVIINSLPNGGTTSFGNLIYTSFGFSNLDTLTQGIVPQRVVSILWFLLIGYITRRWRKLRFACMMFSGKYGSQAPVSTANAADRYLADLSVIPAFVGMLCISLLPKDGTNNWTRWGCFLM